MLWTKVCREEATLGAKEGSKLGRVRLFLSDEVRNLLVTVFCLCFLNGCFNDLSLRLSVVLTP